MVNRYSVTLHQVITMNDDLFDCIDGVLQFSAEKNTRCKEDSYFAVKVV